MPAATEAPTVALSFANNFWGKDDAGVGPLLGRMLAAKQTCDELKSFYGARAALEDEYARKLMSLSRKALGSHEMGTLKVSLDTMRGEVESMAKQHASIAAQMKSELEEPLAAFSGGMKERRKIVQNTVEKLLKTKVQQTQSVNKTRDRYEQECLKIKGYLAQGHMVMGQEERKNKAKLEKTQITLATSNTEYENAVKALEDTTARWNREWKAACDKFQDLEEERLDFTKSSLWTFANIASTVCVSDDASCEKIRLSLEHMEVEKDIINFITEKGTGQEIPDAPKYINFCRGDVEDHESIASVDDESYSVAQFPRSINPAYRTSSPQPSTFESHHDPNSALARDFGHGLEQVISGSGSREATVTPQKGPGSAIPPSNSRQGSFSQQPPPQQQQQGYDASHFAPVPHDPYPLDGMTMLCRTDGPGSGMNSATSSNLSSNLSSNRPSSRDDNSEYSNPTSLSSQEGPGGKMSQMKQQPVVQPVVEPQAPPEKRVLKKKSGFFQNHSPFRRKSVKEVQATNRNTWGPSSRGDGGSASRRPIYQPEQGMLPDRSNLSPEPIDANASLALNVGSNVFAVSTPDRLRKSTDKEPAQEEMDPIALALAELKGVAGNKQPADRISADHYHGIATPAPGQDRSPRPFSSSAMAPPRRGSDVAGGMRGTPPPYDQQVQRLGVPAAAVTSRTMQETSRKYAEQARDMFNPNRPGSSAYGRSQSRPGTRGTDMPRATSPASPRPGSGRQSAMGNARQSHRSASPNPYSGSQHQRSQSMAPARGSDQGYYRHQSPNDMARSASPAPLRYDHDRPSSSDMAVQLAPAGDDGYGSQRSRDSGAMAFYDGRQMSTSRQRSKSLADPSRQYTRDGRPILHLARALYMYQAAIPEELGFSKGDMLAVLRHQDDGWWEAEIHSGSGAGRAGLLFELASYFVFHGGCVSAARSVRSEYVNRPIRAATAPAAQRFYLNTFLFVATSLTLLFIAAAAYPVFYYAYVPKKVVSVPVHLQYNAGVNPFGVTSLSRGLMLETAYDVSVELTLPRSPPNVDRGNFMIALFAMRAELENPAQSWTLPSDPYAHVNVSNVVFSSRRPALVPYTDPLVARASRLLFLPWHLLTPTSEQVRLVVPMGELVEFRNQLPLSVLLDVQAGQNFQVYSAQIELVARLTGIRWMMYNHRIISFVVFTTLFWLAEIIWMVLAWLVLASFVGGRSKNQDGSSDTIQRISETDGDSESALTAKAKGHSRSLTADESGSSTTMFSKGKETMSVKEEDGKTFIKEESPESETVLESPQYRDTEGEGSGTSYSKGRGAVRRRSSQAELS
ncbi:hypothetical protein BX600DRAFT_380606 [Xylariales sp. PMI_506]|nr:hypothetical protein BX600DRAFT_380606 [Xylariales sp. PMI_506]